MKNENVTKETVADVATKLVRKVVKSETIPGGAPYDLVLKKGQVLRIVDLEGRQGVDFLCFNKDNTEERYNLAHSIKKAATLNLTKGHVLYSDAARPMLTIIEDTCGHNDTIAGCCTEQTNWLFYGQNKSETSCRANFLGSMEKYGLGRRDLVGNLNFFCIVPVAPDMSIPELTFADAPSKAGDFIDLRAEMDLICVISNCPQINNPCSGGKPTPIQATVWEEA
jgi:urea carboxylase-associated protein 1